MLFADPAGRPVLETLCQVEAEVRQSLDPRLEHTVAHARLDWWREELERTIQGAPLHPLTRRLVSFLRPAALGRLGGLIETTAWDLAQASFPTRRELSAYCTHRALAVELAAAHALSQRELQPWRAIGAALCEIELLAALDEEARQGRLRLPLDELESAGVHAEQLAAPPWPEALVALLASRHELLRAQLRELGSVDRELQPGLRGLLVWMKLAWTLSLRAQAALPGALHARRLDALSDTWTAWQAARAALARRYEAAAMLRPATTRRREAERDASGK